MLKCSHIILSVLQLGLLYSVVIGTDSGFQCHSIVNTGSQATNNYCLHHMLKKGLANQPQNLYNIQKAKLNRKATSKIACLPVNYVLKCRTSDVNCSLPVSDKKCSTDHSSTDCIECDKDINATEIEFLWSSFDTSSRFGQLLLNYTIFDLRVLGFGWEDDCYVYNTDSVTIITISIDEPFCVAKDELCNALQYITTLLPSYSVAQNISLTTEEVSIGYSKAGHPNPRKNSSDPFVLFIYITVLLASKTLTLSLVIIYYNTIKEYMRWKTSAFYYLFWGCHCFTLLVLLPMQIIFLSTAQSNISIVLVTVLLSRSLDIVLAIIMLCVHKRKNIEQLPVPLSSLINYTKYTWIMNFVAMFSIFAFISELLQMIPNILISYYAYPSKTLTHLAFFQVVFVCLVVAFGGILLLLEKCAWLCYIHRKNRIPNELNSSYLIDELIKKIEDNNDTVNRSATSTEGAVSTSTQAQAQQEQSDYGATLKLATKQDDSSIIQDLSVNADSQAPEWTQTPAVLVSSNRRAKLRHSGCDTILIMTFQLLAALIGLVAVSAVLLIVGMIIFLDSTTRDDLQGILTILPTIAVDTVVYMIRKRLFSDERAAKSELTTAVNESDQSDHAADGRATETTHLLQQRETTPG